ncbi:MAG: hypothetical protein Q9161_005781 [Pseudevernia consocians]
MSADSLSHQAVLNSAKSTSSLPALAAEIIMQIFKFTDNFVTATGLSSTSRRFQSTWKIISPLIWHATVARSIPCYHQAFEYPLDAASSEQIKDMGLIASKVAQQFYGKADIASLALHFYQVDVIKRGVGGPSSLTEAQRTSFPQALYRLYTLASLANSASDRLPYDLLASLDLLEIEQMTEALHWLMHCCPNEHRFELRIRTTTENINPGVGDWPSLRNTGMNCRYASLFSAKTYRDPHSMNDLVKFEDGFGISCLMNYAWG